MVKGEQQKRVEEGRLYHELKAMRHSVTRGVLHGQKTNYEFSEKALHAPFNDFLETLDEARKEFPIKQFKYEEPSGLPLQQYKARYEKLAHEMLEALQWFEKWFGSS